MTESVVFSKPVPLGARLKEARARRKLSITKIARELDVDPRTVARWQSGETKPSYERLVLLAALLGEKPSYFLDEASA